MSSDSKGSGAAASSLSSTHHGIKIFTYPKIIFLWPTLVVSIICAIIMFATGNKVEDPTRKTVEPSASATSGQANNASPSDNNTSNRPARRFSSTQNVVGMVFLLVFFFNLLILAVDFPRFTILAVFMGIVALAFFLLWLNVYFDLL